MSMIGEGQEEQAEQESPETVALAREMGWKPESEWKGDPPKNGFTSATDYIKRGEKILPIVNARARKAEDEVKALRAELETTRSEQRDTIRRIERMSTVALAQQREQIEAQYVDRKEKAVEVGDMPAYRQAVKDEREATAALDRKLEPTEEEKRTTEREKSTLPKAVTDTIDAWKADNPWYKDNDPSDEMTALATFHHQKLQKDKKGLTLAENLAEVSKYIRKRYPEQFAGDDDDEPDKGRGSRVEGGSRLNGGSGRSGYGRLPAEAKTACDKFIKEDGLFLENGETAEKNMAAARERYAKGYWENNSEAG